MTKNNSRINRVTLARGVTALLLLLVLAAAILVSAPPGTSVATSDAIEGQYAGSDSGTGTDFAPPSEGTGSNDAAVAAAGGTVGAAQDVKLRGAAAPAGAVAEAAAPAAADTSPPQVSGITPPNGSFTGPMPVMGYDFSDPSGALWPDGVHLYIDNRCSRTLPGATDISSSNLAYTPAAPLAEGTHRLRAFICDNLFNCGTTSWNITVDTTDPQITAVRPTGSLSSGDVAIEADYNDGTGSGIDIAGVRVTLDGADISGSCSVNGSGLSCAASGLGQGIHQVSVSIPDLVGLIAERSWSFSVDASAVGITGQTPVPGSWSMNPRPGIAAVFQPATSGTIDPSTLTVLLDGVDVTPLAAAGAGGFSLTPADALPDGAHTVEVRVSDDARHAGLSLWSFMSDSTAPSISAMQPVASTGSMPTVAAAYDDAHSGINQSTVRLLLDGDDVTAASTRSAGGIDFVPAHALAAGNHQVQLEVGDLAGNRRSVTWSFKVVAPAAVEQPAAGTGSDGGVIQETVSFSFYTASFSPGRWSVSGLTAYPNTYYLPWTEAPVDAGIRSELVIRNRGAGEAFVSVFASGNETWSSKVAEEGWVTVPPAGAGPLKVICPTGQPLEVTLKLAGDGWETSLPGVNGDDLSTVWLLPWYEGSQPGVRSTLALTNAGGEAAEVDVYIGDSMLPESRRGHFTIAPETSALAEFPGVSGGMVKVVSTSGQPLSVAQSTRSGEAISLLGAVTPRQLDADYSIDEGSLPAATELWLTVANPNAAAVDLTVSHGGSTESIRLAPEESRSLSLDAAAGSGVTIDCEDCGFGHGIAVGWRALVEGRYSEGIIRPELPSPWH